MIWSFCMVYYAANLNLLKNGILINWPPCSLTGREVTENPTFLALRNR
jgi:hypothetical protein